MEGVAFIAALYPSSWPFGGGDYSAVYTSLNPQRTRYGFGYVSPLSPAVLIHALGAIVSLADRLWCGSSTGGIVVVIIVYWGTPSSSNTHLSWAEPDINHLLIGKIYLTNLKSCRCLTRGQKIREPYRQKMRKSDEG